MWIKRHYAGLLAASLLLAPRLLLGADSISSVSSGPTPSTTTPIPSTDAMVSGSASSKPLVPQVNEDDFPKHKYYTITAYLREEYDSNIYTAKTNQVSSFKTNVSPSILVDYPTATSTFSGRYTFVASAFYNPSGGSTFNTSQNAILAYTHNFSDRFSISVADSVNYSTEPAFFDNTGTLFRNGAYVSNNFNASLSSQWTPLISSTTTYSNTIVGYENSSIAIEQNSMENTGSQSIGFAILPKINLIFGGIVDNIYYKSIDRGYTSTTGNTGIDWQALPSLSLGVRVGGSVTQSDNNSALVSPYASLTLRWKLGVHSSLGFDYSHSVAPTDVFVANGQTADRFLLSFNYDISRSLTAHVAAILTHGEYPQALIAPGTISAFSENDYAFNAGLSFHLIPHMDLEGGYTFTGVSSGLSFRDYTRNQVYIGVRGGY